MMQLRLKLKRQPALIQTEVVFFNEYNTYLVVKFRGNISFGFLLLEECWYAAIFVKKGGV